MFLFLWNACVLSHSAVDPLGFIRYCHTADILPAPPCGQAVWLGLWPSIVVLFEAHCCSARPARVKALLLNATFLGDIFGGGAGPKDTLDTDPWRVGTIPVHKVSCRLRGLQPKLEWLTMLVQATTSSTGSRTGQPFRQRPVVCSPHTSVTAILPWRQVRGCRGLDGHIWPCGRIQPVGWRAEAKKCVLLVARLGPDRVEEPWDSFTN